MKVAHLVSSFIEDGGPGDELVDLAAVSGTTGVEPVVVRDRLLDRPLLDPLFPGSLFPGRRGPLLEPRPHLVRGVRPAAPLVPGRDDPRCGHPGQPGHAEQLPQRAPRDPVPRHGS